MYDAAADDDNPIYDDNDNNVDDNTEFDDSEDDDEFSVPVGVICPYCGDKSPSRTTIINNHLVWVCSDCFIDILKFETARRRSKGTSTNNNKQEFIQ